MAMADFFVGTVAADYSATTLTLVARGVAKEIGYRNQETLYADDNSDVVISYSSDPLFWLEIPWSALSQADADTIIDFYMDSAKANCRARSIQYTHADGYTYTVKFVSDVSRDRDYLHSRIALVKFRVLGVSP